MMQILPPDLAEVPVGIWLSLEKWGVACWAWRKAPVWGVCENPKGEDVKPGEDGFSMTLKQSWYQTKYQGW